MQEAAGVSFLRLNGCPKCNNYVYLPDDKRAHCPQVKDGTPCGAARFDEDGKPLEVVCMSALQIV